MTMMEMEQDVRSAILDTESSAYRFQSEYILNSIYKGVQLLFQIRPESRYNGVNLVSREISRVTAETVTAVRASTLPIDPRWKDALIYFAIGKCYEVDSSDTVNAQLANDSFTKFNNLAKL